MILKKNISKEELKTFPIESFEGDIYVIDSLKNINDTCVYLNQQMVLGFDTETRPTFKKGRKNEVALLQLATENEAFLFRLNKIGLPLCLKNILSNKQILKVGVAIKDDIRILCQRSKFSPQSFIELQETVKQFDITDFSLKKLSALLLGFTVSKSQQTSNWEAIELSPAQQKYAATDAWVALKIHRRLGKLSLSL